MPRGLMVVRGENHSCLWRIAPTTGSSISRWTASTSGSISVSFPCHSIHFAANSFPDLSAGNDHGQGGAA